MATRKIRGGVFHTLGQQEAREEEGLAGKGGTAVTTLPYKQASQTLAAEEEGLDSLEVAQPQLGGLG